MNAGEVVKALRSTPDHRIRSAGAYWHRKHVGEVQADLQGEIAGAELAEVVRAEVEREMAR